MSDLEALYRAVLARPEEDTPRLAYADEVEERGDPARAELIRLQCEITRQPAVSESCPGCGYEPRDGYHHNSPNCVYARLDDFYTKENRHLWERWEPACVACWGRRREWVSAEAGPDFQVGCPLCNGTGRQPCRWDRGFPVVEVSALRQAWEGDGPPLSPYRPTPWLCDLIRTHHVVGVRPMHLEPGEVGYRLYVWAHGDAPPPVLKHCYGIYASDDEARAALARAVALAALEWLDAQGAGS